MPGEGTGAACLVGLVEFVANGARTLTEVALLLLAAPLAGWGAAWIAFGLRRLRAPTSLPVAVRALAFGVAASIGAFLPSGAAGFFLWMLGASALSWALPSLRPRAIEPVSALVLFALASVQIARASGDGDVSRSPSAISTLSLRALTWADPTFDVKPPPEPAPPAPPAPRGPVNVLLVTTERLRWDRLGAHGYARAKTPFLDELARGGVDFQFAYTASTEPARALASIATGLHVSEWLDAGATPPEATLSRAFAKRGDAPLFLEVNAKPPRDRGPSVTPAELFPELERAHPSGFSWVHFGDLGGAASRLAPSAEHDRAAKAIDDAVREIVTRVREREPETVVVFASLAGDDFGERVRAYGDATVYEEAVRVPLVVHGPGVVVPSRPVTPVSLVDVAPSIASWARLPALAPAHGASFAEAVERGGEPEARPLLTKSARMSMVAAGSLRLVCAQRETCALFDLTTDPRQRNDLAGTRPDERERMMRSMADLRLAFLDSAAADRQDAVERAAFRAELGIPGARSELEELLRKGDEATRLAAAAALFDAKDKESLTAVRAAMEAEKSARVREAIALVLVRLGDTVPLARDLLVGGDVARARLAALAFAESGDDRGADILMRFWREAFDKRGRLDESVMSPRRAGEVAMALGTVQKREAVGELIRVLGDPRLLREVSLALAAAGEDAARPALAKALVTARAEDVDAIAESLLELGGGPEMAAPLIALMGRPEPPAKAIHYALRAKVLRFAGGPTREAEAERLRRFATSGVLTDFVVPKPPKRTAAKQPPGVRAVCRVGASEGGELRIGKRKDVPLRSEKKALIPATQPELEASATLTLSIPPGEGSIEVFGDLPAAIEARHGKQVSVVVYATQGVQVESCALVPLLE